MTATGHQLKGRAMPQRKDEIINVDIIGPHHQHRTKPSSSDIINVDIIGPC